MRLLHPDPAAGLLGLRAMKTIVSAAGPIGPSQRAMMEAAKKVILHLDADIDALQPVTPAELAAGFPMPELRQQFINGALVISLADGVPAPEAVARVAAFAAALGVDTPALTDLRRLAEHHMLIFKIDFLRRSQIAGIMKNQLEQKGPLGLVKSVLTMRGLMVGRTPEYLGKKIEGRDVKFAALSILVVPAVILGFTAWAVLAARGQGNPLYAGTGPSNPGPHGFSEILYGYSSTEGNNGSAFAGLQGNNLFYNTTLAASMWLGRFFEIIPVLALAGSLALKKAVAPSAGTMATDQPLFVGLLIGVILIVGALTFLPALALGPILEHLQLHSASVFGFLGAH